LPGTVKSLQTQFGQLSDQLAAFRQLNARNAQFHGPRPPGQVTDDCARALMAHMIQSYEKAGALDVLGSTPSQRDFLTAFARDTLGLSTRTALTTTDIGLPIVYSGQIRELISEYGIARRHMSPYPITMGTARPARMGTRPAFTSIAMSAPIGEKSPTIGFASLESHKVGGIVRLPREIDEQSIVPMGHFLARYGAIEFARVEDQFAFLADGSGNFESVRGIIQVAREGAGALTLAAGKTKPSDATLDDFRALRRKVNKAALNGKISAYYLDTTWETRLPGFNSQAEPHVYQRLPNGNAILDGYPIIWTDILEPYGTVAAGDKCIAVFGALSFWWFGEHGSPRVDTSRDVFFANDQLAIRFIEEVDFDYCVADSTAVLLTAGT
jgi:HK97 family phage major capsid protein